jgi:hypothetical protein
LPSWDRPQCRLLASVNHEPTNSTGLTLYRIVPLRLWGPAVAWQAYQHWQDSRSMEEGPHGFEQGDSMELPHNLGLPPTLPTPQDDPSFTDPVDPKRSSATVPLPLAAYQTTLPRSSGFRTRSTDSPNASTGLQERETVIPGHVHSAASI